MVTLINSLTRFSRDSQQFLDDAELSRRAPSVFAEAPALGVSDRYTHARTIDVVNVLRQAGWFPTEAKEHRTRIEARMGFQKHFVRFARELSPMRQVGDSRLEVVLSNSHDGTTAYRMDAGIYRLACSNGLVVSDAAFEARRLTHRQADAHRFIEAAEQVADVTPVIVDTVRNWQGIMLNNEQKRELAVRSFAVRFPEDEKRPNGLTADGLLKSRRYGDDRSDLWTTFNVIQENAIKGVTYYDRDQFGRRKVRVVKSPSRDMELNKALWAVASDFAAVVGRN